MHPNRNNYAMTDNNDDYYRLEQARLIREQKAMDKFLTGSGCCLICFISDPFVLEEHHLGGRKHNSLVVTICANHHAILSRMQGRWPREWLQQDLPANKRMAFMARGISDIFRVISDELLGLDDNDAGSDKDGGGGK